jgi:hypothetical protein
VTKAQGMDDIRLLFREMGQQLGTAIGEAMIESVRAQLPRLREEMGIAAGAAPRRLTSAQRSQKVSLSLTKPCPVPGCNRPGRGPRFSFLCEVHRDMPASEREKYRIRPKR